VSALSSKSAEWQTPPWLVEKCKAALGGYITLDAAATDENKLGQYWFTQERSALDNSWAYEVIKAHRPTLFLNPPGERSGKLIRAFWNRWEAESECFYASVWVDFNLDHLRFVRRVPRDCLIVPRFRMAFVDPATGRERKGAQLGGFLLFRGAYQRVDQLFPANQFLVMQ
jgi:phage N-6-adenine-methyltransferase